MKRACHFERSTAESRISRDVQSPLPRRKMSPQNFSAQAVGEGEPAGQGTRPGVGAPFMGTLRRDGLLLLL